MITFKIVTPEGIVYEDSIDKVTIPTQQGAITVYPEHAPLVSVLRPGPLTIHKGKDTVDLAVSGGFLEIRRSSEVYVLADTAERAEHIDISRAEEAHRRAQELLKQQKDVDDVQFARIQASIEKELNRISVGNKYRKIKP